MSLPVGIYDKFIIIVWEVYFSKCNMMRSGWTDGRLLLYVCAEASKGRLKVLRADIIFDYRSFEAGTI